ncbi:MAG: hypothetical protein KGL64_11370 [Acidobacteriota bacterium]|nr:hypothetical protein [Acidobacteriota bacterium]
MGEVRNIEVPLHWIPIPMKGNHFDWHKNRPKTISAREAISGSKVYRWALRKLTDEIEYVYVGETERFQDRVSAYRNCKRALLEPDGTVQLRIKNWSEESGGGVVQLEFLDLDVEPFCINGKRVTNASLGDHATRLMMESIAIFSALTSGLRVLNKLRENARVKELKRNLKDPKQLELVLSALRSKGFGF